MSPASSKENEFLAKLSEIVEANLSDERFGVNELAREMGRNGRKRITEKFSADIMAASIESVYRKLLSEKGIHLDS